MSWATRGRGRFFYRNRRRGGRVVTEYLGRGPEALLAAAAADVGRKARRAVAAERARLAAADAESNALVAVVEALARAALLTAGYHRHARGTWRRRRGRALDGPDAGAH
jgi:hypothetical protein